MLNNPVFNQAFIKNRQKHTVFFRHTFVQGLNKNELLVLVNSPLINIVYFLVLTKIVKNVFLYALLEGCIRTKNYGLFFSLNLLMI